MRLRETGALDEGQEGVAPERLVERFAEAQAVAGTGALDGFDQRRMAAAHQVDDAAITSGAEALDNLDGIGLQQRHVEKDHRRPAAIERGKRLRGGMERLRLDARRLQHLGQQIADADFIVDDIRKRFARRVGAACRFEDRAVPSAGAGDALSSIV